MVQMYLGYLSQNKVVQTGSSIDRFKVQQSISDDRVAYLRITLVFSVSTVTTPPFYLSEAVH